MNGLFGRPLLAVNSVQWIVYQKLQYINMKNGSLGTMIIKKCLVGKIDGPKVQCSMWDVHSLACTGMITAPLLLGDASFVDSKL